jgi:ribosomal protein S27AE
MANVKRGRRRKHSWIEFPDLEQNSSREAVYLRWVSVNNPALAQVAHDGCPRCHDRHFRLRHDEKFNNVRFYCPNCAYETSFHIIRPKQGFSLIEIYDERGILVGLKNVDDHHEKTSKENADARVVLSEQKLDLGGEWFDGVSGTNSQSRYVTREEVLKRLEDRKMKRLMEANLEEIEGIERDERSSSFKPDTQEEDVVD